MKESLINCEFDGAVTLDNVFPLKFCINLDRRPDRWAVISEAFERFGVQSIARLAAFDGESVIVPEQFGYLRPVDYACTLSHLTAVKKAQAAGSPNVLIFEDDCLFDPDFVAKFPKYMRQVPADWDMLFLGGYHFAPPAPVSRNIVRAVTTLTAHAYAVRQTIYSEFIALNENPLAIVDRNNTILQQKFNCYCCEPNLVGQLAGYSDLMFEDMPEKPLGYSLPITGKW
jgi:GR25 family glycosyltransferase involved in LPS biosynthesis